MLRIRGSRQFAVMSNIILLILLFISNFIAFLMCGELGGYGYAVVYSVLAIMHIFVIVRSSYIAEGKLNFYSIFMLLSLVFYFGHHLMVALNMDLPSDSAIIRLNNEVNIKASFFILLMYELIHIGYTFGLKYTNMSIKQMSGRTELGRIKTIGWILLLVTLPFAVYHRFLVFHLISDYGYIIGNRMAQSLTGLDFLISYISGWYIPACYLLLIAYAKTSYYKYLLLFPLAYVVMYLLGGSRFEAIEILAGIFLLHHYYISTVKITFKRVLMIVAFSAAFMFVLTVIPEVRLHSNVSDLGALYRDVGKGILEGGYLKSILEETGITYTTIANTIDKCPSVVDFAYGSSIVGFVLLCLPSFLRFGMNLENFSLSHKFSVLFYGSSMVGGYGSSYIAELYYNFGYLMFPIGLLIGGWLSKIDKRLTFYGENRIGIKFFIWLYMCSRLIFVIRTDVVSMGRYMLYYAFIPALLCIISFRKGKTINNTSINNIEVV